MESLDKTHEPTPSNFVGRRDIVIEYYNSDNVKEIFDMKNISSIKIQPKIDIVIFVHGYMGLYLNEPEQGGNYLLLYLLILQEIKKNLF